jgi:retrograde regulation protein 2
MSSTHGVSHSDRARLALLLEERYQGELRPREVDFKWALQRLLSLEEVWWTRYLGKVGLLLGKIYTAGYIDEFKPRIVTSAEWSNCLGRKMNKDGLVLTISIQRVKDDPMKLKEALEDHVGIIEKVGKKNNWISGHEGWGMAVRVKVIEEGILLP